MAIGIVLGATTAGCGDSETKSGTGSEPPLPTGLSAEVTSTRFLVADHMIASMEMQVSGEPFAELLGRDIGGYDRFGATTDLYTDPETGEGMVDPLGFGLAVESYEYSKQPMNNTSFEAGAGLSLAFGSAINPNGMTADEGFTLLFDRIQYLGLASRASGAVFGKDFVTSPPDASYENNYYGWPAFWPVFAEFKSFDPAISPVSGTKAGCDLGGAIDEPVPPELLPPPVGDYECDYNSLNLTSRDAQVEKVIEPDALGYAAWKQTLWAINYWFTMHDIGQNPIEVVPEDQLDQVGIPGNTVIGQFPSPIDPEQLVFGKDGTFLGGVSLEGFQGLVMIEELDNKARFLLQSHTTADGSALSGFASVKEATDYTYTSAPRWWPASVDVTETEQTAKPATKYFPKPTSFTVKDGGSRLQDLSGVLGAYANFFAMTDAKNPEIGGSQMFRATFDGDPWAADNQIADGEDSPHDRALAILKVGLVNLDKLHYDAANNVLVNSSTASASGATLGTKVDTYWTANAIIALRTTLRALNSSLSLYGNDTPDQLSAPTPLDTTSLDGAPFSGTVASRIVQLVRAEADFIAEKLLDEAGLAANGYDLAAGARDASATTLEAQASAIRALLEAYLVTSDQTYREAAVKAFAALEANFWMEDIRAYRTKAGESSVMEYTPRNFGALQGALRQHWKLVSNAPGKEAESEMVLAHIIRHFKLVANGWNDLNGDDLVDEATECMGGRLQMAERALSGEFSKPEDGGDRDHDCVPDVSTAGLPAALAAMLVIKRM